MIDVIERARGRWHEILPLLGISLEYLKRTRGPCPICGGKNRFSFRDTTGYGDYDCRQCGPGTGLILLRKKHGWSDAEARANLDDIVGPEPVWTARSASAYRCRDAINRIGARVVSVRVHDHARGFCVLPIDSFSGDRFSRGKR